jgi:hypothetical protein
MRPAVDAVPGRLVELVGPAGAGKSTLARAFPTGERGGWNRLSIWGLPFPLLMNSAVTLVPTVLRALVGGKPLRPAEIGQMVRLGALQLAVERSANGPDCWIVLDEGPVFGLTWLEVFFERNGDPGWSEWRRETLRAWSDRLDAVVRLDAADPVLAHRIRARIQNHMVKDRSDEEIFAFLARFRQAYDRVLAELSAGGRPIVMHLQTDASAPIGGVPRLRATIEEALGGR